MEEAALLPPVDGNSLPGGESLRSRSTDGELDEKGPFVVWQGVQSYGEASRQRILQSPDHPGMEVYYGTRVMHVEPRIPK